jgi:hypothetical protein
MNSELVVNLWAIYDANIGYVYNVAGRAYNVTGTDKEKLTFLKSLSATDYVTSKRYRVPNNFKVVFPDGSSKEGVAMLKAVYDSDPQLFEELFRHIESDLPPTLDFSGPEFKANKQKLPNDPLCVTTVLYESTEGHIRPIITDEDRSWIAQQEALIHKLN